MRSFFDIDLDAVEREKEQLLQVEQNKHKPHHCQLCGSYIEEDNLSVCNKCASEYEFLQIEYCFLDKLLCMKRKER